VKKLILLLTLSTLLAVPGHAQDDPGVSIGKQELPKPLIDFSYFFTRHIKFPDSCFITIKGTVYIGALVNEKGNVDSVKIAKGLPGHNCGLDSEVLRVAKMIPDGSFVPARTNGKPIKAWVVIPLGVSYNDMEQRQPRKKNK
jgi:hypothetical protein